MWVYTSDVPRVSLPVGMKPTSPALVPRAPQSVPAYRRNPRTTGIKIPALRRPEKQPHYEVKCVRACVPSTRRSLRWCSVLFLCFVFTSFIVEEWFTSHATFGCFRECNVLYLPGE